MPGLVPGIHVFSVPNKTWMAGTSPAMTRSGLRGAVRRVHRSGRTGQTLLLLGLEPRRSLQLIEPVASHLLHHAIAHHDQPRLRRGEMLMCGERRAVDVIAFLPLESLRHLRPFPFECVETIELHVPMQIVAASLDHEDDLLPHMAMLAGALAGLEKLHIGFHATLAGAHAVMGKMLDQ